MKLEVLLAMMVSPSHSPFNERSKACFAPSSSTIASMTSSAPETVLPRSVLAVIAATAGSIRALSRRPSDDNLYKLARMSVSAVRSRSSLRSWSRTW